MIQIIQYDLLNFNALSHGESIKISRHITVAAYSQECDLHHVPKLRDERSPEVLSENPYSTGISAELKANS
jgi:hypothetical protein